MIRRADEIREEKGWSEMDPAAEVQATFDSHAHQRQHGDGIWDYPGGMPPESVEEVSEEPATRAEKRLWEDDPIPLLSDPHFDRGVKRLALAQVQRENPSVDFSFLEPETRESFLFGDNGFAAKLGREMRHWGPFSPAGGGWGQSAAMSLAEGSTGGGESAGRSADEKPGSTGAWGADAPSGGFDFGLGASSDTSGSASGEGGFGSTGTWGADFPSGGFDFGLGASSDTSGSASGEGGFGSTGTWGAGSPSGGIDFGRGASADTSGSASGEGGFGSTGIWGAGSASGGSDFGGAADSTPSRGRESDSTGGQGTDTSGESGSRETGVGGAWQTPWPSGASDRGEAEDFPPVTVPPESPGREADATPVGTAGGQTEKPKSTELDPALFVQGAMEWADKNVPLKDGAGPQSDTTGSDCSGAIDQILRNAYGYQGSYHNTADFGNHPLFRPLGKGEKPQPGDVITMDLPTDRNPRNKHMVIAGPDFGINGNNEVLHMSTEAKKFIPQDIRGLKKATNFRYFRLISNGK
ncbi:MAG: hypothetical protein HQL56_16495 [Magnetococcales bacterium]|nr:hypothetical protein [Magnetococcales bacterium]